MRAIWIKAWLLGLVMALLLPLGAQAGELAVETALKQAIAERTPWDREDIVITDLSVPKAVKGAVRIELPGRDRWVGHVPFKVVTEQGDRLWASARIEVMVDALVAARSIGRHQVISNADLSVARMPLSRSGQGTLSEPYLAVGKRATQRINRGRAITGRMVESPPVIRRGDKVTLMIRRPGLTVTAVGEAREDGGKGRAIQVMNLGSRRMVQGRVLDANTVEVVF